RRQQQLPEEDRPAFHEMYTALTERLYVLNDGLLDWFIRTRRTPPVQVILDLDGTDDPVHGQQALSGYHGYYQQHQYFPLLAFEGNSGFPLAAWLCGRGGPEPTGAWSRPWTGSCGGCGRPGRTC